MKLLNLQKRQIKKIVSRNFLILQEFLNVAIGDKSNLFFEIDKKEIKVIKNIFPKLSVLSFENPTRPTAGDSYKNKNHVPCIISQNKKKAKKLINLLNHGGKKEEEVGEIGELLGYPSCCIDQHIKSYDLHPNDLIFNIYKNSQEYFFINNNLFNFSTRLRDNEIDFQNLNKYFSLNKELQSLLNTLQYISHIPCSYDCKKSLVIGKKTERLLNDFYPELNCQIKNILNKPVIFFGIFEWIILNGEIRENNLVKYDKIISPLSLSGSRSWGSWDRGSSKNG